MLIVNRRVASPVERTSRPRSPHASRSCSSRSAGRCEPSSARLEQERREHVGDAVHPRVVVGERLGVVPRKLRDFFLVAVGLFVEQHRAAVGERDVRRAHRDHVVAVALELQVADDRRRHQAHDVRERRHLEVGSPRCLGRRRAARVAARFEDHGAHPGAGEVGAGDEPVVSATDDDRVERFHRACSWSRCWVDAAVIACAIRRGALRRITARALLTRQSV